MSSFKKYNASLNKQISSKSEPKEIIYELLNGLNNRLAECIKNIENEKLDDAKRLAKKAQNIAFALRSSLDHENGGEIAKSLDYIYGHIQFATDNLINNDKSDTMNSAYYVSTAIFDGWKGLVNKTA